MTKRSKRPSLRLPQRHSIAGRSRAKDSDKVGNACYEKLYSPRRFVSEPKLVRSPRRIISLKHELRTPTFKRPLFRRGRKKGSDTSMISGMSGSYVGVDIESNYSSGSTCYDSVDVCPNDEKTGKYSIEDSFRMIEAGKKTQQKSKRATSMKATNKAASTTKAFRFNRPHTLLLDSIDSTDSDSSAGNTTKIVDDSLNKHMNDVLQSAFSCGTPREERHEKNLADFGDIVIPSPKRNGPQNHPSAKRGQNRLEQLKEDGNEDDSIRMSSESTLSVATDNNKSHEIRKEHIKVNPPIKSVKGIDNGDKEMNKVASQVEQQPSLMLPTIEANDSESKPSIDGLQRSLPNTFSFAPPLEEGQEQNLEDFQNIRNHDDKAKRNQSVPSKPIDNETTTGVATNKSSDSGSQSQSVDDCPKLNEETNGVEVSEDMVVQRAGSKDDAFAWEGSEEELTSKLATQQEKTNEEVEVADVDSVKALASTMATQKEKSSKRTPNLPPLSARSDLIDSFMLKDNSGNIVVTPVSMIRSSSLIDSVAEDDDNEEEEELNVVVVNKEDPKRPTRRKKKTVRKIYTSATPKRRRSLTPHRNKPTAHVPSNPNHNRKAAQLKSSKSQNDIHKMIIEDEAVELQVLYRTAAEVPKRKQRWGLPRKAAAAF